MSLETRILTERTMLQNCALEAINELANEVRPGGGHDWRVGTCDACEETVINWDRNSKQCSSASAAFVGGWPPTDG